MDIGAFDGEITNTIHGLHVRARALIGRKIKIISKYNGQPYGNSRKDLNGTTQVISSVTVDHNGLYVWVDGYTGGCVALATSQWELLP